MGDSTAEPAKVLKSKPWATIVEKLSTANGHPVYGNLPLSTNQGLCTVSSEIPDSSSIR